MSDLKEQTKETLKKYVAYLKRKYPEYSYKIAMTFEHVEPVILVWPLSDDEAEKVLEDIQSDIFDMALKNGEEPPLIVNLTEGVDDDLD